MKYRLLRGANDGMPDHKDPWLQTHRWNRWAEAWLGHVALYGYEEARTPVLEDYDLFVEALGVDSTIIAEELYELQDPGDKHLALRPELTASTLRAILQNEACPSGTVARLNYLGPVFRHCRPGLGHFRESYQAGIELVGSPSVSADVEVIEVAVRFLEKLGIQGPVVQINSVGRDECQRRYSSVVLEHADKWLQTQSAEIQAEAQRNPLSLFQRKEEGAMEALANVPPITDYLEAEGRMRFEGLQELLGEARIGFELAPRVFRGMGYYTDTVFEIQAKHLAPGTPLCGGGRYDGLAKNLGGYQLPGVGMAIGMERCLMELDALGFRDERGGVDAFVVLAMPDVFDTVREVAETLRNAGIRTLTDVDQKSVKQQIGQAERAGAKFVLIIGVDEVNRGRLLLRKLDDGTQESVPFDRVAEEIQKRL